MSAVNERLNLLLDLGKCREAAALAREELAREPRWGTLHTHLARALVGMGEVEAAIAAAREGVKYAAFDAWSHDIHGFVLAQAGRYRELLAETAEALRLSPEWVGGHWNAAPMPLVWGGKRAARRRRQRERWHAAGGPGAFTRRPIRPPRLWPRARQVTH